MKESRCADGRRKADVAIDALKVFAENVPAGDHLGLLVFDRKGLSERIALDVDNRDQFYQELNRLKVGGGTPLGTAIDTGKRRLEHQARQQLGYGEFNLIVVTDGEADSDDLPHRAVDYLVNETPVVVQDHRVLHWLRSHSKPT